MCVLLYNVRSRLVNEGEPAEFAGTGRTFGFFAKEGRIFLQKNLRSFITGRMMIQ